MGRFVRSFCSAAIVGTALAVTWNRFLDDKAKASVKRCAGVTKDLADHLVATYMSSSASQSNPGNAQQNQSWVTSQWSNIGY